MLQSFDEESSSRATLVVVDLLTDLIRDNECANCVFYRTGRGKKEAVRSFEDISHIPLPHRSHVDQPVPLLPMGDLFHKSQGKLAPNARSIAENLYNLAALPHSQHGPFPKARRAGGGV